MHEKFYASPYFKKLPAYKMYYKCITITKGWKDFLTETANLSSDFQAYMYLKACVRQYFISLFTHLYWTCTPDFYTLFCGRPL